MDMPTSHEIDHILIFFIDSLSLAVFREQKRRLLQVRPARNAGPDVRAFHYEGRTPFCGPVLFAEQAIWRQMRTITGMLVGIPGVGIIRLEIVQDTP